MEILKRFEEEREEDDFDNLENGDEDDEDDEGISLLSRLDTLGISVDDASPEAIWNVLTKEEQNAFLKTIKDPNAVSILSHRAQSSIQNEPWWKQIGADDEDERTGIPKMINIPSSLIPLKVDPSRQRPPLIYNLVSTCLAYAHVVRLTTSPLPIPGKDGGQVAILALRTLRDLLPFIFNRESKHAYLDLESVFFDLWSRISDMDSNYFTLILQDTITILTPRFVVPHSISGDSLSSSPHRSLLLLLSDIYSFLLSIESHIFKEKKVTQSAAYKIRFYSAQILSPISIIFPADGVRFVVKELEVELKTRSLDQDGQDDSGNIGYTKSTGLQVPDRVKTLIQELDE